MSDFDAHGEAVKLGGLARDCMEQYCQQYPIEAMQKEQAVVKEAATFWQDSDKLLAVSKEFEKLNQSANQDFPKVDILVGNGEVLVIEFSPLNNTKPDSGVRPELSLSVGDVDKYGHQGLVAMLEDHSNKNNSIVIKGQPF